MDREGKYGMVRRNKEAAIHLETSGCGISRWSFWYLLSPAGITKIENEMWADRVWCDYGAWMSHTKKLSQLWRNLHVSKLLIIVTTYFLL